MLSVVYFLLAAAIAVPLFKRLGLGAILGYLAAGVVIGPAVLGLINDPENVLHFSEIGVILLLFVIGLELEPAKLWAMRAQVLLLGGGQLLLTAAISYLVLAKGFGMGSNSALVVSMALALSSTAFAVQLMADKGMMGNEDGRRGFSILLFQDLAVVPILFVVQALSPMADKPDALPWWIAPAAVTLLVVFARFLINPALNFMSRYGGAEIMTVVALLIVMGAAVLMDSAGLSMGLGAFLAGMMLANSTFRHQLEADVEPFKGLSLGLFFISIGMTLNLGLLRTEPMTVMAGTLGLMALKAAVVAALVMLARVPWSRALMLGLMLSQGGEFGFVIMSQALSDKLLDAHVAGLVNLVVGLSMALTSPVVIWAERRMDKKALKTPEKESRFEEKSPEVLILGFGRFGQVTGRILAANHIPFTALDKDADHIEFVRRFGNKVFYGDAARREIMEAAGLSRARIVVVAIDEPMIALNVVEYVTHNYPKITLIARAHNRADYIKLKASGAKVVIREVFAGALEAATETLVALGFSDSQALSAANLFEQHDRKLLEKQAKAGEDPDKLIQIGLTGRQELEELFRKDQQPD
ncbi:monovalent cation:proton antiporter-2 (CPA2) family protein [Limnobacter litoralis]|uniref:Portal protein n=1 Tax=Limnobacter litoralis TaxID=481366 RepID=A0ABQ5YVF2_9BURK|nr:monovalent cation:proton antiporter-2 (CPA2) family protein [Limnobacter litoralis]GLR26447.1 portal protein [Limnobacter litoralis]